MYFHCDCDIILPMKPTIATERTILRQFTEDDADDMYAYARTPKVGPMAGWKPHESVAESRNIIKMFIEEDEVWAIVLKETGRVIGSVGLHKRGRRGLNFDYELGYVLSEDYWGRGIIPEVCLAVLNYAFTEGGAETILCSHFPFNTQSKRVIEKLGFTYVKRAENSWRRFDGVTLDEEIYQLEKPDFLR